MFGLLCPFVATGCAASQNVQPSPPPKVPQMHGTYQGKAIQPQWFSLLERLRADGLDGPDVWAWFAMFETPSEDPMGRKITELYKKAFFPKPPPSTKPVKPRPLLYPDTVTPENVRICREFVAANQEVFDRVEQESGVPSSVAVALLFIETKLGKFMGKNNALYTLASMASSRAPTAIPSFLAKLPDTQIRLDWIQTRMEQRSDWAYKELVALIKYSRAAQTDPLAMPGSIYGAVGYCQFMPSNIVPYGADGDGDGIVNLFTIPDAVASLSLYLKKHGWKTNAPRAQQHNVIKTYNKSDTYANTILTLAEQIRSK